MANNADPNETAPLICDFSFLGHVCPAVIVPDKMLSFIPFLFLQENMPNCSLNLGYSENLW